MSRILGVDYGERSIGLAVSDPLGVVATPLKVVDVVSQKAAYREVSEACRETGAEMVVVGIPINMDGSHGAMAIKVSAFVEGLAARLDVPVKTWDERLSTTMVERVLIDADVSRRKRKKVRDKLAAQVILQGFLDSREWQ